MKKIIITIIAITMMMSLASCGEDRVTKVTRYTFGDDYYTETVYDNSGNGCTTEHAIDN